MKNVASETIVSYTIYTFSFKYTNILKNYRNIKKRLHFFKIVASETFVNHTFYHVNKKSESFNQAKGWITKKENFGSIDVICIFGSLIYDIYTEI